MAWLPDREKFFEDMFIRFHATHERDIHTHTHTDTQTSHNGKNGLRHNVRHYKLYGDKMADSDSEDELRKVLSSSHGFAAECQFKAVIYRRRRTVWVRTYI